MSFTGWAHSHARSILFLLGAVALGGAVTSFSLPVALFPQVSFPRVRVTLDAGDRPAERMAIEVTTPVEEAVRAIPGVRSVRSTTSRGTAEVSINFDWGENMVAARLQSESQINKILPTLPAGTSFEVERFDPTVFPAIAYSLVSDSHSLVELRDLALYTLRPVLSTVQGVARVGVQGGRVEEYRVTVDPDKLQSFKMTLAEVASALSASNVLVAVVLLIFLRVWKVTLIAILTVPAVLAATILLLYVLKMSFNIMTLGGMAAAVGLIIDDAIVMVEHIVRRVRGTRDGDGRSRVMRAASEFTNPLAGSSAATIVIFTPLAFLTGVTGAFFKALSLTMAASLIISFAVAWLAVPILCANLLKEEDADLEEGGAFMRRVHEVYRKKMQRLLREPRLVVVFLLPLLLLGFLAFKHVASGFMPVLDEGGCILDYISLS